MHVIAEADELDDSTRELLRDFDERGFVVVRDFLTDAEIERLVRDYEAQPRAANQNYDLKNAGDVVSGEIRSGQFTAIADFTGKVAASTTSKCDTLGTGCYFAVSQGINFGFHQDHECYWMNQDVYHYLNYYIPVVKPAREKSNLHVIPFDRMPAEMRDQLIGQGATRFIPTIGEHGAFSNDSTGSIRCHSPLNLDDLIATPELAAGDLLLMRGDMLHKTQDTSTDRVALSFRAFDSRKVVSRNVLLSGGLHKLVMMLRDPGAYSAILATFEHHGQDELTVRAVIETIEESSQSLPEGDFLRLLLSRRSPEELHRLQYAAYLMGLTRGDHEGIRPHAGRHPLLFTVIVTGLAARRDPHLGPLGTDRPVIQRREIRVADAGGMGFRGPEARREMEVGDTHAGHRKHTPTTMPETPGPV